MPWRQIGASNRPLLLAIAGSAFAIGAWLSIESLRDDLLEVDWALVILVALLGVPASILLNALEFREMGRLRNVAIGFSDSTRTAVLSTAANLMPLPGGVLVRSGELISRGVTSGDALKVNALAGIYSVGLSGVMVSILFAGHPFGLAVGIAIASTSTAAIAVFSKQLKPSAAQWRLFLIEVMLLVVTAVRAWLIIKSLGVGVSWTIAAGIASVYPIAALVGVFPGGLALREFLAGLVTGSLSGGASAGFLIAALDRLIGLVVHAPIALLLTSRPCGNRTSDRRI